MFVGLIIILLCVLILPFVVKVVEHNLEIFLFIMGLAATVISGVLTLGLIEGILKNHLLYFITLAVLVAGLIFKVLKDKVRGLIEVILKKVPIRLFVFILIVLLGLMSSVITAIISALLLTEIVSAMPIERKEKVKIVIFACFSIGLGAVLTPIGEPLATIVTSKLGQGFWYLAICLGKYIIPGMVLCGIIGAVSVKTQTDKEDDTVKSENNEDDYYFLDPIPEDETYGEVVGRSAKIFVFIFALELLGAGFKPLIDTYLINLDSRILYFINMISAILDNATLAAAEISIKMTTIQIESILMGLLISGGMLIPGNIPNIISAHKLKIKSKEWAKIGVPTGLALMLLFFVIIFVI